MRTWDGRVTENMKAEQEVSFMEYTTKELHTVSY